MRYLITALFLIFATQTALSQQLTVHKSAKAQSALQKIDSLASSSSVMGYRIGIFFDNGAQARSKATEARDLFAENFPAESVYMVYQSPYYKVSAGDCLTEEEAIMLFEKIRKVFPNAYLMRETMEIERFIKREIPLPIVDSTQLTEVDALPVEEL